MFEVQVYGRGSTGGEGQSGPSGEVDLLGGCDGCVVPTGGHGRGAHRILCCPEGWPWLSWTPLGMAVFGLAEQRSEITARKEQESCTTEHGRKGDPQHAFDLDQPEGEGGHPVHMQ